MLFEFWLSVNTKITTRMRNSTPEYTIQMHHTRMLLNKLTLKAIISGISLKILEHNVIIAYLLL